MIKFFRKSIASFVLAGSMASIATPAFAQLGVTAPRDLAPVPVLVGAVPATGKWQGHWAQNNVEVLIQRSLIPPTVFQDENVEPDGEISTQEAANILLRLAGFDTQDLDAIVAAVSSGLILAGDFENDRIVADVPVPRELFGLWTVRAMGQASLIDHTSSNLAPTFGDADQVSTRFVGAIALLQQRSIVAGKGDNRFWPKAFITRAEAYRILFNVWVHTNGISKAEQDPANATYVIDGQVTTLSDGKAERPIAPGSTAKSVTTLSDEQVSGDVDGDGMLDVAAILIHSPGGSGTFYYLTVLLGSAAGRGTPADTVFLGDRILTESLGMKGGQVTVNYLTHAQGEPMAATPATKIVKTYRVHAGELVEVKVD